MVGFDEVFFVEDIECRQADVGHLFLVQRHFMIGRDTQRLGIDDRSGCVGCAACQRQ
jgi:hypothetical protein